MKKIFTLLFSASIILLGNMGAASAQTQLTNEQKQAIQKEILPAVFKQMDQQFGIDIPSFIQPETLFQNILKSSMGNLRSDDWTHTPMDIRPDSAILSVEIADMGISSIKLVFSDYQDIAFPTINRYPANLKLPKVIQILTGDSFLDGLSLKLHIDPIASSAEIISGVNIGIGMAGSKESLAILTFERLPGASSLASSVEDYLGGFNLVVNIDGVRAMLGGPFGALFSGVLPTGFQLPEANFNILVTPELLAGTINASLYAIPAAMPTMKVPMGDAVVALDLLSLSVRNITLTAYDDLGVVAGWSRLWPTMKQVNSQDLVLTIAEYGFASAAMTDSVYLGSTIYTMSDYTSLIPTTSALVAKALDNVAALLRAEHPAFYKMVVERIDGEDAAEEKVIQQVIEIIPYFEGNDAIASILIQNYTDGVPGETTEIKATAYGGSELIILDILDAAGVSTAKIYFNTNILQVLSNEDALEVPKLIVSATDNGIYVNGCDKGTYSIISMMGTKLASGTLSGNYIQTPNLNKGIYVFVLTVNGKTQTVKFVK